MAEHRWNHPPGAPLGAASIGILQQAVNYPKGLHGDSFDSDLVLPGTGPGSRMMLLGPQTIPASVNVTVHDGAVLMIL